MRVVTCASCRDQTVLPVIADSWQMNEEELRRLIHRPGGKHGLHP
ncbi:MAG TPA: hypothetical protein VFO41_17175 [Alphaproteobacteria bacterium]|nr:hypothetical protein [Alphaproteobacteria bacterium]